MPRNSVTEVTNQSWLSRIGGAIKGIFIGLILFVVAFPLLFWNEGRAVKRHKALQEGGKTVISVASDSIDTANENKLIHVTGLADTEATLADPVFNVSAKALKLKRSVEMYQWEEKSQSKTTKKLGGGTQTVKEYTYSKAWSSKLIKSENFKEPAGHENPAAMPYESTDQSADKVTLGAFTLSPSLVSQIRNFEPLAVDSGTPLPMLGAITGMVYEAGYYFGTNSVAPLVGDVRVNFDVVKPMQVSVIAKQVGNTFAPYITKGKGTIELLSTGVQSADEMILSAQAGNKMLTWMIRLVGFLFMLGGLNLFFRPLSVVADVLPIAGTIVGAGTGIISLLLAALSALVTIAIAWIVYRPLLGIILIAVAVGVAIMITGKLKSAKAA